MASQQSALVPAIAGAAAGAFAAFAVMPLELVKTRVHMEKTGDASLVGTLAKIAREQGPLAVFQGASTKCTETGAKQFVYFFVYDALNNLCKVRSVPMSASVKLLLGYSAGVINTLLTMPLECLSTRCQADITGASSLQMLRAMLADEGLAAFFKGFGFNLLLCINPAIQNTVFDKLKMALLNAGRALGTKDAALTSMQAFFLGAFAKTVATLATFPLVRLKILLQLGSASTEKTRTSKEPTPSESGDSEPESVEQNPVGQSDESEDAAPPADRDAAAHLLERPRRSIVRASIEQIAQLYRGVGSAITKSVLQAALLYMTKESVERFVVELFKLCVKLRRKP